MNQAKYRSVIVSVDSLQHWAKNPRIITEEHVERLVSMMRSHKGLEPLIVEEDGTVLGGNARLIALRKIGETEAWAIVVHPENDKERVEIALQDNDHVGITDKEKLMPLVSSLSPDALGKYSVSFDEGIDLASVMTKFGPSDDVDPFEGQNIEKIVDVTINCFGGPDAKAQNALMCALQDAAEAGGSNIYEFMENTPKTSFIVELYDALKALGYKIEKV